MKKQIKYILFNGDDKYVFSYLLRKDSEKDMRIFNKERMDWEPKYQLFKLISPKQ